MVAVGHPFDTVKTRLQLQLHPGIVSCCKELVQVEGPRALYRGAAMPLVSLVTKRPFEFVAFEWFNSRFKHLPGATYLGGFLAGILGAMLGCPFSVVKIQLQASGRDVHANTRSAILAVWRSRGSAGFYQGLGAMIIQQVPYGTVYLGTYGKLRERLPKSYWSTAVAGGVASLTTWTLLMPLDTVKTRIQAAALQGESQRRLGWTGQLQYVVREVGPRGLWAGWGPAALRSLPTSAASMLAYEKVRSLVAPEDR
mmetsp:Transcript_13802/g.38835  ORF Transcript_13802/g.38835 Transcript_13802/m.38835 type:complete len:254 (-) Transcript_13802:102-863(-)